MKWSMSKVFLLAAVVLCVLAAFGVQREGIGLLPLGVACFAAAALVASP